MKCFVSVALNYFKNKCKSYSVTLNPWTRWSFVQMPHRLSMQQRCVVLVVEKQAVQHFNIMSWWSSSFSECESHKNKNKAIYIFPAASVSIVLWYVVRHHVVSGAGGRVGVKGSSRRQWGRRCSGGLLGMLQLLAVYLPLFGSSVLKPDLHLRYQRHKLFSVWFNWKILGHCLKYNDAKSLPCSLSLDSVCNAMCHLQLTNRSASSTSA